MAKRFLAIATTTMAAAVLLLALGGCERRSSTSGGGTSSGESSSASSAGGTGAAAAGAADLSNPRGAATAFAAALDSGDAAGAKAASIAANADDEKIVEMMAAVARSMHSLADAAKEKFGDAGNQLVQQPTSISSQLEGADVQVSGNTAVIKPKSPQGFHGDSTPASAIQLKRDADGKWKVDIASLTRGQNVAASIPRFESLSRAASDTAREIRAGSVKNVGEARQAMAERLTPLRPGTPTTTSPGTATNPITR